MLTSGLFYPFSGENRQGFSTILTSIFTTGIIMVITQLLFISAFALTHEHGRLSVMTFSTVIMSYIISIFRYHESVNIIATLGTGLTVFGILKCILNKS